MADKKEDKAAKDKAGMDKTTKAVARDEVKDLFKLAF